VAQAARVMAKRYREASVRSAHISLSWTNIVCISMNLIWIIGVALLTAVTLLGGSPSVSLDDAASHDGGWFDDVARRAGIQFVHQSGHRDRYLMPEIMGAGAAVVDMDGDGLLDIYFVQSGSLVAPATKRRGHVLYRNRGDGTFQDASCNVRQRTIHPRLSGDKRSI
jgi:hypothetical protein